MVKEIGISLSCVLEMELLAGAAVLAGKEGLSRVVTSVNIMEISDIPDRVSPGQLSVAACGPLAHDASALTELINRLNSANVAGLGVKLSGIGEVPPEMIEIADCLSFPIFEIPRDVSFHHILTRTLDLITDKRTEALQEMQDLHQSLTSTMLNGGTLRDICNLLHQRFGNSVAIDSSFLSSFVIHTTQDKYQKIYGILQNNKRMRKRDPQRLKDSDIYRLENDMLGDTCCNRITVPIYSDQILYGHIYMWEDHHRINQLEMSSIRSVTSLIALDIMERLSIFEIENNHKSGFLDDLLSANSRRQQKALSKARFYDFNPQAGHQVIVVSMRGGKQSFKAAGKSIFHVSSRIISLLRQLAKRTSIKILYVNNDVNIVILCEIPSGSSGGLPEFLENLTEELEREYISNQVVIGVGRRYGSTSDLYRSYSEARRAASCPHLMENNAVFYENMGVNRLLSFEGIRKEAELFCEETLGPLLHYDMEKDSELVKTLAIYFRCRCNLARLSEELEVHYNTVFYRMQRIRDLTGLNLDCERDLLDLQIALKIHEMRWDD